MTFNRSTVTAPIVGRRPQASKAERLAAAADADITRAAGAELRRRASASPVGPQIAQPQQIAGTPSTVGRVRA